jgi:CRP-like cAMP-binding protein
MSKTFPNCIENISFLDKFPRSVLIKLLECSLIRKQEKREVLFLEHEKADNIFVVLKGGYKIYKITIDGCESVERLLVRGDLFGEESLSANLVYTSIAEATTYSQILMIPSNFLKEYMKTNYQLGVTILHEIINNQQILENKILCQSTMTALQKVGWYISNCARTRRNNNVYFNHDKSSIASYLGIRPETFSRSIKRLKNLNINSSKAE